MSAWISVKGKFIDLTNKKIANWKVIKRVFIQPKKTHWLCECECGNFSNVSSSHLLAGRSTKCKQCHNKNAVRNRTMKHGHARGQNKNSSEYRAWSTMKTRCRNPNHENYSLYGGRGIKVCKRWDKFENFLDDMGLKPKGYTLERINVNGNYTKSNCKWDTIYNQARNKRNNIYMKAYGKELTKTDWAKLYNIPYTTFSRKINKFGWPFSAPPESE